MESSEEEQFWFQLLTDLGSAPSGGVAQSTEALTDYYHIHTQPITDAVGALSLLAPDHGDRLAVEAVDEAGQTIEFHGKVARRGRSAWTRADIADVDTDRLRRVLNTKDVWAEHYPAAYDMVKSQLVFSDDQIEEAAEQVQLQTQISSTVEDATLAKRNAQSSVISDNSTALYPTLPLHLQVRRALVHGIGEGLQFSSVLLSQSWKGTTEQLGRIAQLAVQQLYNRMLTNEFVAGLIAYASEVKSFLDDRVDTVTNACSSYLHSGKAAMQQKAHEQRMLSSAPLLRFCLRCCMASIPWEQRQMIEETMDETFYGLDNKMIISILSGPYPHRLRIQSGSDVNTASEAGIVYNGLTEIEKETQDIFQSALKKLNNNEDSSIDDVVEYLLAKAFTAPKFVESSSCYICGTFFSIHCFRHHCRYCGKSVCNTDSQHRRAIHRFGMLQPVRVCSVCKEVVDRIRANDELIWKDCRVRAYLAGKLLPYSSHGDDDYSKLSELSLLQAGSGLDFEYPTKIVNETARVISRYGLTGYASLMMRQDFMECIECIKCLTGIDEMFRASLHEMTACVYYKLAIDRGIRGCRVDQEMRLHDLYQVKRSVETKNDLLSMAIRYAPLALNIIYEETCGEMQRLAALQNLQLLFANAQGKDAEKPAVVYGLFAVANASQNSLLPPTSPSSSVKEAIVVLRSTQRMDVMVNHLRQSPVPFPAVQDVLQQLCGGADQSLFSHDFPPESRDVADESHSYVCGAFLEMALQVIRELGPSLLRLVSAGYRVVFLGHCMGGAVATICTKLLLPFLHRLRCIAYGNLSCVDLHTARSLEDVVYSVVLRDDFLSRLTPESIRLLRQELLHFRSHVFRQLHQDWNNVTRRTLALGQQCQESRSGEKEEAVVMEKLGLDTLPCSDGSGSDGQSDSQDSLVLVDASPLSALYLPGRILHIFSYRGQHQLAEVTTVFPDLRRLALYGNMFRDHQPSHIMNALLEVRATQQSAQSPPPFTPFDAANACSCCRQLFSWHSTFRGAVHEFRERYHCKSCGALVCGLCSRSRRPIVKFGMLLPRRVCDKCELSGDYAKMT